MASTRRSALMRALGPIAALVVGLVYVVCTNVGGEQESAPASPRPAATAEVVPDGHVEAVEAAKAARQREGQLWRELQWLRLCLSSADVGLREFRDNYQATLVGGAPGKPVAQMYKISRDDLQACDRVLAGVEGPGAVPAARYREMIAGVLPGVLVLRDYYRERDYLDDSYAAAREQHPALTAGLEQLDPASAGLRARVTEIREALAASLPESPPDLAARLYFAILEVEELLVAGAEVAAIEASLARVDEIRDQARKVVADLAGSTRADRLDDVLGGASGALATIKEQLRRKKRDASARLSPVSLQGLEHDFFRWR